MRTVMDDSKPVDLSAAHLAAIVESADDAITSLSLDGIFWTWNAGAERLYGYSSAQAVGQSIAILIPPDRPNEVPAILESIARGERIDNYETVRRRADGSPVDVALTVSPIRDRQRTVVGVSVIARDISARRRAEEALAKREAELREAQRIARIGSWEWLAANNTVTWSEGVYRIVGLEPDDRPVGYEGRQKFYTPESWARLDAAAQAALASGDPYELDVELVRADGSKCWVTARGEALRNTEGRVIGLHGTIHDISERRQAEQQQQLAQRLETVGQLAGGIAHEFNNLLTVIQSYVAIAADRVRGDDPIRGDLFKVAAAAERAVLVTRQLSVFGRRQVLKPHLLNLNTIVTGMNGMLRHLVGDQIDLEITLEPSLGLLTADPWQLEQVVLNLALNARDAMPNGGTLLIDTANAVFTERSARPGGLAPGAYVRLSVVDTGCGIDEAAKARLFEPFFTTKAPGKGTGLGLATVYGIVTQSGGTVTVESELGHGAAFHVYLPLAEDSALNARPLVFEPAPRAVRRETILVVEDEDAVRNVVEECLTRAGYIVVAVANGREGLEACQERGASIDLVLTDVVMPEMNGKQLADRLAVQFPNLKVLFMSGYTTEAIQSYGVEQPHANLIGKPFSPSELAHKVRQMLDA